MIYVINEDSGAGFEFFNIYVKAFTDAKEVEKPDTSHGNCGLDAHFNEITEDPAAVKYFSEQLGISLTLLPS